MEGYSKKQLEERLQQFRQEHQMALNEAEKFTILSRKYEGAIETIQLMISEMDQPVKKESADDILNTEKEQP